MLPKECRKYAHTCLQLAGPREPISLGASFIRQEGRSVADKTETQKVKHG